MRNNKKSNKSTFISVISGVIIVIVLGFVGASVVSFFTDKYTVDWIVISSICALLFTGLELEHKVKIENANNERDNKDIELKQAQLELNKVSGEKDSQRLLLDELRFEIEKANADRDTQRLQMEQAKHELEKVKWELENYDKIVSGLSADNDGDRTEATYKLIELINNEKITLEKAIRLSKTVTSTVKEEIKKLHNTPKLVADNYSVPNRLSSSYVYMLELLSLCYEKYNIRADFKGVNFSGLDFTQIKLLGADFTLAVMQNAFFDYSNFSGSEFFGAYIENATFIYCILMNTGFNVKPFGSKDLFNGAHFEGADISHLLSKHGGICGAYVDSKTILPKPFGPYLCLLEQENGLFVIARSAGY